MKKFKNKSTGEVVTQYSENHYQDSSRCIVHKRFIENSCDWEEVEEKDYEVMSLIHTSLNNTIITYENGGGTAYAPGFLEGVYKSKDYFVECFTAEGNPWKINSVKRLSDGEVFTIGEQVTWGTDRHSGFRIDIKSFHIEDEELEIKYTNCIYNGVKISAPNFRKLGNYLFITEDGKEIFEGDSYWCVNVSPHLWNPYEQTAKARTHLPKNVKAFTTEELLKEFIVMNKPLLSLDDLLSVWNSERDDNFYSSSPLFRSFKNLAKTKL